MVKMESQDPPKAGVYQSKIPKVLQGGAEILSIK